MFFRVRAGGPPQVWMDRSEIPLSSGPCPCSKPSLAPITCWIKSKCICWVWRAPRSLFRPTWKPCHFALQAETFPSPKQTLLNPPSSLLLHREGQGPGPPPGLLQARPQLPWPPIQPIAYQDEQQSHRAPPTQQLRKHFGPSVTGHLPPRTPSCDPGPWTFPPRHSTPPTGVS